MVAAAREHPEELDQVIWDTLLVQAYAPPVSAWTLRFLENESMSCVEYPALVLGFSLALRSRQLAHGFADPRLFLPNADSKVNTCSQFTGEISMTCVSTERTSICLLQAAVKKEI